MLTDPTTFFTTIQDQVGYRNSATFLAITVAISAIGLGLFGKGLVNVPKIWISVVIGNYIAGIFFFGLFKVFGGKASLEKTIRANNYAIAPAIVSFIPVVGWFSGLYSFYLMYLGFKITHQVSAVKAFLITFIPVASFSVALAVLSMLGRFLKH